MPRSKGRTGRPWRRAAQRLRDETDVCWICGHGGAVTIDHEPSLKTLEALGLDPRDPQYLRIAHGSRGRATPNPCPQGCGYCNQRKGTQANFTLPNVTPSRNW